MLLLRWWEWWLDKPPPTKEQEKPKQERPLRWWEWLPLLNDCEPWGSATNPSLQACLGRTASRKLIGSIRRECADHVIALGEAHLRRILQAYARYYNDLRTHRSLDKDAPFSRPVQRSGSITSQAILGGPHHHYMRV